MRRRSFERGEGAGVGAAAVLLSPPPPPALPVASGEVPQCDDTLEAVYLAKVSEAQAQAAVAEAADAVATAALAAAAASTGPSSKHKRLSISITPEQQAQHALSHAQTVSAGPTSTSTASFAHLCRASLTSPSSPASSSAGVGAGSARTANKQPPLVPAVGGLLQPLHSPTSPVVYCARPLHSLPASASASARSNYSPVQPSQPSQQQQHLRSPSLRSTLVVQQHGLLSVNGNWGGSGVHSPDEKGHGSASALSSPAHSRSTSISTLEFAPASVSYLSMPSDVGSAASSSVSSHYSSSVASSARSISMLSVSMASSNRHSHSSSNGSHADMMAGSSSSGASMLHTPYLSPSSPYSSVAGSTRSTLRPSSGRQQLLLAPLSPFHAGQSMMTLSGANSLSPTPRCGGGMAGAGGSDAFLASPPHSMSPTPRLLSVTSLGAPTHANPLSTASTPKFGATLHAVPPLPPAAMLSLGAAGMSSYRKSPSASASARAAATPVPPSNGSPLVGRRGHNTSASYGGTSQVSSPIAGELTFTFGHGNPEHDDWAPATPAAKPGADVAPMGLPRMATLPPVALKYASSSAASAVSSPSLEPKVHRDVQPGEPLRASPLSPHPPAGASPHLRGAGAAATAAALLTAAAAQQQSATPCRPAAVVLPAHSSPPALRAFSRSTSPAEFPDEPAELNLPAAAAVFPPAVAAAPASAALPPVDATAFDTAGVAESMMSTPSSTDVSPVAVSGIGVEGTSTVLPSYPASTIVAPATSTPGLPHDVSFSGSRSSWSSLSRRGDVDEESPEPAQSTNPAHVPRAVEVEVEVECSQTSVSGSSAVSSAQSSYGSAAGSSATSVTPSPRPYTAEPHTPVTPILSSVKALSLRAPTLSSSHAASAGAAARPSQLVVDFDDGALFDESGGSSNNNTNSANAAATGAAPSPMAAKQRNVSFGAHVHSSSQTKGGTAAATRASRSSSGSSRSLTHQNSGVSIRSTSGTPSDARTHVGGLSRSVSFNRLAAAAVGAVLPPVAGQPASRSGTSSKRSSAEQEDMLRMTAAVAADSKAKQQQREKQRKSRPTAEATGSAAAAAAVSAGSPSAATSAASTSLPRPRLHQILARQSSQHVSSSGGKSPVVASAPRTRRADHPGSPSASSMPVPIVSESEGHSTNVAHVAARPRPSISLSSTSKRGVAQSLSSGGGSSSHGHVIGVVRRKTQQSAETRRAAASPAAADLSSGASPSLLRSPASSLLGGLPAALSPQQQQQRLKSMRVLGITERDLMLDNVARASASAAGGPGTTVTAGGKPSSFLAPINAPIRLQPSGLLPAAASASPSPLPSASATPSSATAASDSRVSDGAAGWGSPSGSPVVAASPVSPQPQSAGISSLSANGPHSRAVMSASLPMMRLQPLCASPSSSSLLVQPLRLPLRSAASPADTPCSPATGESNRPALAGGTSSSSTTTSGLVPGVAVGGGLLPSLGAAR